MVAEFGRDRKSNVFVDDLESGSCEWTASMVGSEREEERENVRAQRQVDGSLTSFPLEDQVGKSFDADKLA